jgi:hypothetical protein
MMYEFKKWGNGDSYYEVILKTSYNPLSKTFDYKSLGMVEKRGNKWVAVRKEHIIGKTRKEVADMLKEIGTN